MNMDDKPPEEFTFDDDHGGGGEVFDPAALQSLGIRIPNGAKTSKGGPCKCGYRHWCDGQEYDYVFQLGGGALGFNEGDNCQTVATKFVQKHKPGFGSAPLIAEIAKNIRMALIEHHGGSLPEKDTNSEKKYVEEKAEIFRPTMNTVTMKDGVLKKTIYPGSEWDKTIKGENVDEATRHKEAAMKLLQSEKDEKEKIKQQLLLQEQERAKEIERLRELQKNRKIAATKKKEGVEYVQVVVNGEIQMVTKDERAQLKGEQTVTERVIGLGDLSDEEESPRLRRKAGGGGGQSLAVEYPSKDIPVEDLHAGHLLAKLQKDGTPATMEWLTELGVQPDMAAFMIMKVMTAAQSGMFNGVPGGPGDKKQKKSNKDDPWGGNAASLSGSSSSNTKPPETFKFSDLDDDLNTTETTIETETIETDQGPHYEEGYKIVVDNSQPKVMLRITLKNKTLCDVQLNIETHTLTNLYNHIRSVSGLKKFHIFDTAQGKPKKLENWEDNMKQLGLIKNARLNIEEY